MVMAWQSPQELSYWKGHFNWVRSVLQTFKSCITALRQVMSFLDVWVKLWVKGWQASVGQCKVWERADMVVTLWGSGRVQAEFTPSKQQTLPVRTRSSLEKPNSSPANILLEDKQLSAQSGPMGCLWNKTNYILNHTKQFGYWQVCHVTQLGYSCLSCHVCPLLLWTNYIH